jgi:hypothetical protein
LSPYLNLTNGNDFAHRGKTLIFLEEWVAVMKGENPRQLRISLHRVAP